MHIGHIKESLNKVFVEHLTHLSGRDADVAATMRDSAFFAGGCIASLLLKEQPSDYDLYLTDPIAVSKMAKYYLDRVKTLTKGHRVDGLEDAMVIATASGAKFSIPGIVIDVTRYVEWDSIGESEPVFITPNCVTLKGKLQVVLAFYGTPKQVSQNFDFVHTKLTYHPSTGILDLGENENLLSLLTKRLVYTGSDYPLASLIRTRKFIERGWSVDAGQYLKIALDVNKLDLTDTAVLRNQLLGVDVTIFLSLMERLEEMERSGTLVDANSYLRRGMIQNVIEAEFTQGTSGSVDGSNEGI